VVETGGLGKWNELSAGETGLRRSIDGIRDESRRGELRRRITA
jgi:hypothetical protein